MKRGRKSLAEMIAEAEEGVAFARTALAERQAHLAWCVGDVAKRAAYVRIERAEAGLDNATAWLARLRAQVEA